MPTQLNQDEIAGFNLAIDLYTNLMFNQKELLTRIVESAYGQGLNDGIAYAQQQLQQPEVQPEPEPEPVKEVTTKGVLSRLKGMR